MSTSSPTLNDTHTTTPSRQKSESALVSLSPLSLQNFLPLVSERALFVGRTGSGKTTLVEKMLSYFGSVVVLDVKNRLMWEGYERHTTLASLASSQHTHLIYAPSWEELRYDPRREHWSPFIEEFYRWVYVRGNTVVYTDEVMGVTRGEEMPEFYRAGVTRGRELYVSMWSATQRPMRIPQVLLSEAEHFYVFNLQLGQDMAKVEETVGMILPARRGHEFVYAKIGQDSPPRKYLLIP